MNELNFPAWTRRKLLGRTAAVAGASWLSLKAPAVLAEAPPETTTIRLQYDLKYPALCFGPLLLAEEFLRLEGFTDVKYEGYGNAYTEHEVLADGRADLVASWVSDHIAAIDKDTPAVALAGLHAGCIEIFANERVESIRDLAGKRILAGKRGYFRHLFLSSVLTYVGLDPDRDVEWVWTPGSSKMVDRFAQGEADVLLAAPSWSYAVHEMKVGRVILNTVTDNPWRNYFCCMVAGHADFVRRNPIATKRAIRALVKANLLCETDRKGSAKRLVELGATDRQDYAARVLQEVPYDAWRDYDPSDTLRFFTLRLREAGLIKHGPQEILHQSDFRFLDEVRRELKT